MDVTTEIHYPGATVEAVAALVLDPEFRTAVCRATAALDQQVDVQPGESGSTVVSISRTLPARVPDFLKRFVGETITLVQTETWRPADASGTRMADLSLQVVDQPATMSGTITIRPDGDGVTETTTGDLRVSVPFVGGKVESEIAGGLRTAAGVEEKTGREWLAR